MLQTLCLKMFRIICWERKLESVGELFKNTEAWDPLRISERPHGNGNALAAFKTIVGGSLGGAAV